MNNLREKFLLLLLLAFAMTTFSQETFNFQKLSAQEGISQSIVYAIAQDSVGNIWMATEEGVIRYNSRSSKNYNKYAGLPEEFSSRVETIFIDSKNRVWIGGENGVALFDKSNREFIKIEDQERLQPTLVKFMAEDDFGNIWIGAFNGLYKLTQKNNSYDFKRFGDITHVQTVHNLEGQILVGTSTDLFKIEQESEHVQKLDVNGPFNITDLARLNDETILVGTRKSGLILLDNNFRFQKKINLPIGRDFPIFDLIVNKDNVYIATDGGGLVVTDKEFNSFDVFQNDEDNPNSISSNGIYDIHFDRENILWIATYGGGVNFYNPNYNNFTNFRHIINESNSLISDFVRSIAQDEYGRIWFGTKKGITIYDYQTGNWNYLSGLTSVDKEFSEIILALEPDGKYMWAGTYDSGVYKISIDNFKTEHYSSEVMAGFPLNKVYDIYRDNEGNLWFGGIDGNLTRISPKGQIASYPIDQVKSINAGPGNSVIVAGRNGIQKLDKKTNEIINFDKLIPGNNEFNYFTINAVEKLNNNTLLIASNGGGLLFYNLKTEKLTGFNKTNGMPSDVIQGVIASKPNDIWASTTSGLVNLKFQNNDTLIRIYDQNDGLASNEFNYGSFARLDQNRLAFGGTEGVSVFDPSKIDEQSLQPVIMFEEFSISNLKVKPGTEPLEKSINIINELELGYDQNSFGFEFVGVLHNASSKVKYSWMLEGFENKWSPPSTTNEVSYTNISPGNYIFKVRAANRLGEFGPTRSVKIEVNPPWYTSPVALMIYFLFFIGLFFLIIYVTSALVNKKNAEQQVNFYNNLTHEIRTPLAILLSSLDNFSKQKSDSEGNERIKGTINRLNSLFEQMLNYQKSTVEESKDIDAIDVEIHTRELLADFEPLLKEHQITLEFENKWKSELFYFNKEEYDRILFNLVSNAIKYSHDQGIVTVKTEPTTNGSLKLVVSDNGLGIPKDQQKNILKRFYRARNVVNSQRPGTGLGLMLVKNIIDKTGGEINFDSEQNKGTTFHVFIKNRKQDYRQSAIVSPSSSKTINLEDSGKLSEFSESKILLVEDNDELRRELELILGKHFQVFEAKNGQQGLEKAMLIFPDLIITDLIMPEMDGLAMSREIKSNINLNHIPIFMLTVLQNRSQKIESLETGISEYLEKPIDINLLIAKVVNSLTWQKKLQKKYQEESELETAVQFRNESDEKFIKEMEAFILERIKDESFSVHDIGERFNMSRTSLYMKLKNLIDLSPQDLIINTRLKYAKNLLLKTKKNIKEVAYESGFSNPKYFSTSFKKFYDMTPSQYRSKITSKED